MSLIIDLILLVIIIVCVLISAKRGFVAVFVECVGFVAAIMLTLTINTPLAEATYDKFIEPPLINAVTSETENTAENIMNASVEKLPEFLQNLLDKSDIMTKYKDNIQSNLNSGAEQAITSASQNVIKPVAVALISAVYSLILIIILFFVVKLLSRLINKLFSFSLVGKINKILGGCLGLVKGIIFASVFCIIISLIVASTKNGFWFFTRDCIDKTVIFNFFTQILPF